MDKPTFLLTQKMDRVLFTRLWKKQSIKSKMISIHSLLLFFLQIFYEFSVCKVHNYKVFQCLRQVPIFPQVQHDDFQILSPLPNKVFANKVKLLLFSLLQTLSSLKVCTGSVKICDRFDERLHVRRNKRISHPPSPWISPPHHPPPPTHPPHPPQISPPKKSYELR